MTLVYLALAWLVGIALGAAVPRPPLLWAVCALAGALTGAAGRRERALRVGGALLLAVALGALRLALSPLDASPLRDYRDGPPVTLVGVVDQAPERQSTRLDLVLSVETADSGGQGAQRVSGRVLAQAPREAPYRYGDRLRLTGVLRTPQSQGSFSYRDYLLRRGIVGEMESPQIGLLGRNAGNPVQAALVALADRAEAAIHTLWPAPESALLAGILLGREQEIPDALAQAFNDTGTRHIIAISGFNITLLAGVLSAALVNVLNRRLVAPVVILLLAFYVALVGADPAVLRAGIMGALTLVAYLAGRQSFALTGLAASGILMTLLNPWALWEPGFQLSFAATLGLIVLEPRLEALAAGLVKGIGKGAERPRRHARELAGTDGPGQAPSVPPVTSVPLPGWLREALLVSLAAQIATLPITLGTFGRLSLVAPVANLLILPAQALVMELGALATVLALLWRPVGQVVAYLAWPFAAYTIGVVQWLGAFPWAAVDLGTAGALLPWLLYPLGAGTWWLARRPESRGAVWRALGERVSDRALLITLVAVCAVIWAGALRAPDGKLHVTFLDVGQGDAILIRTPDGKSILVDGGPDPTLLPAALGRRFAPWVRVLDIVALTHPDEDHLAGLVPILRQYRVGLVLDTHLPHNTPTGQAWTAALGGSTRILYPRAGEILDLGYGVRLQALHPGARPLKGTTSDDNNNCLVLRLSWGKASFLLTGDLGQEGEAYLLRQPGLQLGSTVLKVAHHGAREGTSQAFLQAVRPQIAVISVGAGNRFGHPAPETLSRLQKIGAQVWRTDECGDVEIVTDGERLWVRTGRSGGQPHPAKAAAKEPV